MWSSELKVVIFISSSSSSAAFVSICSKSISFFIPEHECESLSPAITYSRLRVSSKIAPRWEGGKTLARFANFCNLLFFYFMLPSSWVCQSRCLPLHIGCDGVCNINLFLEQRKQRRAKQLRLFGGRKDVIKARREEESRPRVRDLLCVVTPKD